MRRRGAECEGVACEHALGQQPLQLYAYLWSRVAATSAGDSFSFVLPDTVVFRRQKPIKWLFTSKQERGKILCKTKKHLTATRVLQDFIAAKWVPSALAAIEEDHLILASYVYLDRSPHSGEMQMVVEHLDKAALGYLLLEREKPAVSVLQRFVPTKSGYNHAIRSVYTPENCTAQKCVTPFLLSDIKAGMTQRTATFEASDPPLRCREYFLYAHPLDFKREAGDVSDRDVLGIIEKINGEISTHLEAIVGKEMMRLVNYFKIGADNRIYLLWSSMISFEPAGKTSAKNFPLALGDQDTPPSESSPTRNTKQLARGLAHDQHVQTSNSQFKICPSCRQKLPRDQVEYMVTHKAIIRHSERDVAGKPMDKRGSKIPALIRAVNGPIHAERFEQLKQMPSFLYQIVQLCMACAHQLNAQPKPPSPRRRHPSHPLKTEEASAPVPQLARSSHDLFWNSTKKEETRRAETPMVVQTRTVSAGPSRTRFATSTLRKGSGSLHRRHLSQFLPRLHAFEPAVLTPKDGVLQLALQLKRNYGHPSLRFALTQCNTFPIGSMVPLRTLERVCNAELLALATQYWIELFQAQRARIGQPTVDIDALDGLLAARLDSSKQCEAAQDGARGTIPHFRASGSERPCVPAPDPTASSICISTHEHSAAAITAPRRPSRPRSCIPASTSSRQARMTSHGSAYMPREAGSDGSGSQPHSARQENQRSTEDNGATLEAAEDRVTRSVVRTIDGVEYQMKAEARTQLDGDGQFALHLEVIPLLVSDDNQARPAMELTMSATEIMATIGVSDVAPQLRSAYALLESILPRLCIQDGRLLVPQSPRTLQPSPPSPSPPHQEQQHGDADTLQHACPELSEMELLLLAQTLSQPH